MQPRRLLSSAWPIPTDTDSAALSYKIGFCIHVLHRRVGNTHDSHGSNAGVFNAGEICYPGSGVIRYHS